MRKFSLFHLLTSHVLIYCQSSNDADPYLLTNIQEPFRISTSLCPFIRANYYCPQESVIQKWNSCCQAETCSVACSSGSILANSHTLFIGNSHIREIAEALVCQNLDTLVQVSFLPDGYESSKIIMSGREPPAMQQVTYSIIDGIRDHIGNNLMSFDGDDLAIYSFSNGAKIYTAINTPFTFTSSDSVVGTLFGIEHISNYLDFEFSSLTGIIANSGNSLPWAKMMWCDTLQPPSQFPPLNAMVCEYFSAGHKKPVIDLLELLVRLNEQNFIGHLVVTGVGMGMGKRPSPIKINDAKARNLSFSVNYVDFDTFINGHECRTPSCIKGRGHMCLPGPPDDGAKIILKQLYG